MSTVEANAPGTSTVVVPGAQPPAASAAYAALKTEFDNIVNSHVGAWVAGGTALALPIVTALCAWLQKKLGINLDSAELTAFIVSMGAGIVLTAYKWLSNRGAWERAVGDANRVYLTGQAATTTHLVVTPPAASIAPGTNGQPNDRSGLQSTGDETAADDAWPTLASDGPLGASESPSTHEDIMAAGPPPTAMAAGDTFSDQITAAGFPDREAVR